MCGVQRSRRCPHSPAPLSALPPLRAGRGREQRRAQRHVTGGKPRGAGRGRSGTAPTRRGRGARCRWRRRSAVSARPGCGEPGSAGRCGRHGAVREDPREAAQGAGEGLEPPRQGRGAVGAGNLRGEWRQGRVALLWRRTGTAEGPGLAWPWRRLHLARDRAVGNLTKSSSSCRGLQGSRREAL